MQLTRAIRDGEKLRRNLKKEKKDAAPTQVSDTQQQQEGAEGCGYREALNAEATTRSRRL